MNAARTNRRNRLKATAKVARRTVAAAALLDTLESRRLMAGDAVTFTTPTSFSLGANVVAAHHGDIDNDGFEDIVVASSGLSPTLKVYHNAGDGTFSTAATVNLGGVPTSFAVCDFTKDGNVDIGITTRDILGVSASFSLYVGRGDNTFSPPFSVSAPVDVVDVEDADMNGDGIIDLVSVNAAGSVSVFLGNQGGLSVPVTTNAGLIPEDVVIGDFNEDGKMDVIV